MVKNGLVWSNDLIEFFNTQKTAFMGMMVLGRSKLDFLQMKISFKKIQKT